MKKQVTELKQGDKINTLNGQQTVKLLRYWRNNVGIDIITEEGDIIGYASEFLEVEVEVQVSRPDFYSLYIKVFDARRACGWTKPVLSVLAVHLIGADNDGHVNEYLKQLPQRAESCQFSYTDEDDGAAHITRRIDWNYIFQDQ